LKETGFQITNVGVFGTTVERSVDVKICILKTGTIGGKSNERLLWQDS